MGDLTDEATDLLRQLIRNECVNDGSVASGAEVRNADLLAQYLGSTGLDIERYEPREGRQSLVARIEGRNPEAPSLLLMGHLDVVPANRDGWSRDPFGAEVVDGFVWGRGAVDMLNLTATQAIAFKRLADSGFAPEGTLIFLGVADEEAQGVWGAEWLVEHERDAVYADYVLTETGGFQMPAGDAGIRLPVLTEEKGTYWSKLVVHGTPGHGSAPLRTDNALVTAAEVVRRIAEFRPPTRILETWERFIEGMGYPPELAEPLLDPAQCADFIETLPTSLARQIYSCTHTTFAPTVAHGGTKTNIIPDRVDLEIDIRTLPGVEGPQAREMLEEAIGADLLDKVDITDSDDNPATASPIDTPLWDVLDRVCGELVGESALVPFVMTGATDNRFFRRAGAVGYGFGLFSKRLSFEEFGTMFHGNDERVDQESLALSAQMYEAVARDLLG